MIHTQTTKDPEFFRIGFKYMVAPILATLFIFPLFPFSINLIVSKEESFGDDTGFKRKVMFLLMALQFLPTILSVYLFANEVVPDNKNGGLLVEQLLANLLFLTSSMILKFGNYHKDESDSF